MKKKTTQRRTKAAVAATLMAMPMLSSPGFIYAQKGAPPPAEIGTNAMVKSSPNMYLKFSDSFEKQRGDLWLAGVGDGHTIYEKSNGEMFYIDTKTGDMKEVSSKVFMKVTPDNAKSVEGGYIKQETYIKFDGVKGESKVKLLGVDADGNVVHQKPNGEVFTVHKKTGHVTLMK